MALQPKRQTAIGIATNTGELLPHLLTIALTASISAVIFFSVTIPSRVSPLSGVWSSLLPGLSLPTINVGTMEQPTALQR